MISRKPYAARLYKFYFLGITWLVPLMSCFISNLIIRTNYSEEHKDHNHNTILFDDNENNNEDSVGYKLTQPIKKDWFMSKECRLFGPFIAVNVGLFMVYFLLYYFIHIAWQGLMNHQFKIYEM